MPQTAVRYPSMPPLPHGLLRAIGRRAALAGALSLGIAGLARADTAGKPKQIELVSEAWHDLTRKDGSGLYFDLVRMVYERQGVQVRIRIVPYARSVQMVREKRADAWVASFPQEKDFPLYPKWHFDRSAQVVVYRKNLQSGFADLQSLRNQRVAWMRDFGLDRYIREPMKITEVDALSSGLQMLERGRIDYLVCARSDLADAVKNDKINMAPFETKFMLHLGLFLAFADTPRGAQLRDLWDRKMETLHKASEFKALYRKYGYDYPFA